MYKRMPGDEHNTPTEQPTAEEGEPLAEVKGQFSVGKTFHNLNKDFSVNKITRFLLFLFIFFFIFKIIDHILYFFDISKENGYAYFSWFTMLFLFFVLLPTQRSRLPPSSSL